MGMKRTAIKGLGVLTLGLILSCVIVCLVLAGIMYRFASPDFRSDSSFQHTSSLTIASSVYAFFVTIIGFCVFMYPKSGIIAFYMVLLILSILFILAIAIYTFVAGSIGYPNVQLGCQSDVKGVINSFNNIDTYIMYADATMCSTECPCNLANTIPWETDPRFSTIARTWNVDRLDGATAFQNCSTAVQRNVYTKSASTNPNFDPNQNFNPTNFASYMGRIERHFNCAGWCNVAYINPVTNQPATIARYLFSDINRGPPANLGCIGPLIAWLPAYILAWGSVAMVVFGLQLMLFLLALLLSLSKKGEGSHDVIHHERIEVVERQ